MREAEWRGSQRRAAGPCGRRSARGNLIRQPTTPPPCPRSMARSERSCRLASPSHRDPPRPSAPAPPPAPAPAAKRTVELTGLVLVNGFFANETGQLDRALGGRRGRG